MLPTAGRTNAMTLLAIKPPDMDASSKARLGDFTAAFVEKMGVKERERVKCNNYLHGP